MFQAHQQGRSTFEGANSRPERHQTRKRNRDSKAPTRNKARQQQTLCREGEKPTWAVSALMAWRVPGVAAPPPMAPPTPSTTSSSSGGSCSGGPPEANCCLEHAMHVSIPPPQVGSAHGRTRGGSDRGGLSRKAGGGRRARFIHAAQARVTVGRPRAHTRTRLAGLLTTSDLELGLAALMAG